MNNEKDFLQTYNPENFNRPSVTVDIVILSIKNKPPTSKSRKAKLNMQLIFCPFNPTLRELIATVNCIFFGYMLFPFSFGLRTT